MNESQPISNFQILKAELSLRVDEAAKAAKDFAKALRNPVKLASEYGTSVMRGIVSATTIAVPAIATSYEVYQVANPLPIQAAPAFLPEAAPCAPDNPECLDKTVGQENCETDIREAFLKFWSVMFKDKDGSRSLNNLNEIEGPASDRYLKIEVYKSVTNPDLKNPDGTTIINNNVDLNNPAAKITAFVSKDGDGMARPVANMSSKEALPYGTDFGNGVSFAQDIEDGLPSIKVTQKGEGSITVKGTDKRTNQPGLFSGLIYRVSVLDSNGQTRVDAKTGEVQVWVETAGLCVPCDKGAVDEFVQSSDADEYRALKAERGKPNDTVIKQVTLPKKPLVKSH